ncbi:MAG: bacteriohemerythrin [Gallionella sp.]|nr:bacteriohemerythrin [Gallionella sp.]
MSLQWRTQLSVGNDVIDSDHMRLIEIINDVERILGTRDQEKLASAIDRLSLYSEEHFDREEKIARLAGYPQAAHLHLSHEQLRGQLEKVKQGIAAMGSEWSADAIHQFSQMLRNWLIEHVIKEDLLMKPTLQKYPADFNPERGL